MEIQKDFILSRKALSKGLINYLWFLFLLPVVLLSGIVIKNVWFLLTSRQDLIQTLLYIWFPLLILIVLGTGFRRFKKGGRGKVYAILKSEELDFPTNPKNDVQGGVPAFRTWPLSEIESIKTKFLNDPQLANQYRLRMGPALLIKGTYWSISMPAIGLDYIGKFVNEVKQRAAAIKDISKDHLAASAENHSFKS